jgi:multiple sugar transport system permease protein/raffinose/stachyose/melibiose transport system permease protein
MSDIFRDVRWQGRVKSSVTHALLILVSATCLFPLIWMFVSSLKTQQTIFSDMSLIPAHAHWENFALAWTKGHFGVYFLNSLFYTVSVVGGVLLIASLAAYAFARLEFPAKKTIYTLFLATMMIPVPGAFIALYVLLIKLGLVNTRLGYILPQVNGGLPLGIFLLTTFFRKLPKDLEDAARVDGCNKFQVYYKVALPLAKPAIAVLTIFTALGVWNEYLLAMLVLSDQKLMPLQRGFMVFQGAHITQYPLLMAAMTISVVPIIAVYILMQRHIISGITSGALKM